MPRESKLRQYLTAVTERRDELIRALRKDAEYAELTRAEKDKCQESGFPYQGMTNKLLEEWSIDDPMRRLFKAVVAELVLADLDNVGLARLDNLQEKLDTFQLAVWHHWENDTYFKYPLRILLPADESLAGAWRDLDSLVDAVEVRLNGPLPQDRQESPALDDEDIAILMSLNAMSPRLLSVVQIAQESRVSEKTIRNRLKQMFADGLVRRAKGKNGGTTITAKGKDVVSILISKHPSVDKGARPRGDLSNS